MIDDPNKMKFFKKSSKLGRLKCNYNGANQPKKANKQTKKI